MDLFKLGLRNVLGITLPGAILVFIFFYVLFSAIFAVDQPLTVFLWSKDQQFLILVTLFLTSYVLGSLMRLNAADKVDEKSRQYHLKKYQEDQGKSQGPHKKEVDEAGEKLFPDDKNIEKPKDSDKANWILDKFPYPKWQFIKFRLYHPYEVSRFFEDYQHCMGIGPGRRGKEFFNYCKMVIYHASRQLGDALVEEVHFAEAIVRFYAGTYFGLLISFWMLLGLFLFQAVVFITYGREKSILKITNILMTLAFAGAVYLMQRMIVQRFRTLRLKEVDTVYDAFYLVHRHADNCSVCSSRASAKVSERYREREKLLRDAFSYSRSAEDGAGSVLLECLVSLMKERSREKGFLSSLYFAGAEDDHPFFFKNTKIAVGISVLPEDAAKAGISKSHRHQEETIFVLRGALHLETEEDGTTIERLLQEGQMHVIKKHQCHRVLPVSGTEAVYMFVKTNPDLSPRSESCDLKKKANEASINSTALV
jgi:mannose-6-phosphate isomerase-like protein (cupin superfamily)